MIPPKTIILPKYMSSTHPYEHPQKLIDPIEELNKHYRLSESERKINIRSNDLTIANRTVISLLKDNDDKQAIINSRDTSIDNYKRNIHNYEMVILALFLVCMVLLMILSFE